MTASHDTARTEPDATPAATSADPAARALGAVVLGVIATALLRPVALKKLEAPVLRKLRSLDVLFSSPC